MTNSGRLFHARGPATAKARSPSDEQRVAGTTRADDDTFIINVHFGFPKPVFFLMSSFLTLSFHVIPFV